MFKMLFIQIYVITISGNFNTMYRLKRPRAECTHLDQTKSTKYVNLPLKNILNLAYNSSAYKKLTLKTKWVKDESEN